MSATEQNVDFARGAEGKVDVQERGGRSGSEDGGRTAHGVSHRLLIKEFKVLDHRHGTKNPERGTLKLRDMRCQKDKDLKE
jgi:hypothetical protein